MSDSDTTSRPRPPQSNIHMGTTPLGGRADRRFRADLSLRRWTGYAALVRRCPHCQVENPETNLFCTTCAADLRQIEPQPAENGEAGINLLHRRLAQERLRWTRSRNTDASGGSGWIVTGLLLLIVAIALRDNSVLRAGLWIGGLGLSVFGLWTVRFDQGALRGWGITLSAIGAGLLILIGSRSLVFSEGDDPGAPASPAASPVSAISSPATSTPVAGTGAISSDVTVFRGNTRHSGYLPGPPPAGNPRLAWRFDTGGEVYSSPAIVDGVAYVASKSGFLYAINATTGQQIWQFNLSDYVVRSSPTVVDGVVYIGGGFNLFAVDAATGAELWRAPMRYAGQASPTVVDGIVVAASQEGWMYGFDAATGAVLWRIPTDGLTFGAPAVVNEQVIFGTDTGVVYSMELGTGDLHWRESIEGAIYASVAVADDVIYVVTQAGTIYALNVADGTERWSGDVGGSEPAAVHAALVALAGQDGGIYGLEAASGENRWLYSTGRTATSAPVISGDLVITGAGSNLLALDAATGEVRWYYLAGDTIETSPVVADGYVLFGARDGFLYAITDDASSAP